MLPVLPLIIGGTVGVVAGFAFKDSINDKMLDNADNVFDAVDNIIGKAESWLDDKQVALDKYLDKLEPNKDLLNSVTTSKKLDLKALDDLRISVYKSSFTDFANYFNSLNINNENLSKFNLKEDLQEVLIFQDESYEIDKPAVINLKNNKFLIGTQYEVNQGVEFLNKSNKILESINLALKQDANDEVDFIKFSKEKQNLIFEGYDLAKKIEKLCIAQELNDTYTRIKALYID